MKTIKREGMFNRMVGLCKYGGIKQGEKNTQKKEIYIFLLNRSLKNN